ncbi:MAG: M28 family peptidase [Crocinitomicaceae bacterium]|nr:M28 family peptidase [Crocinitomicaceae bacterium]
MKLKINNKYISKYESKNVIGYLPGKKKNKLVVFTAHYDHLGRMGADTYFPGANDNASGCAMLLSLAKYYKANPSNYSFVFCFFSGEEAGLLGSQFFVSHPYFKLEQIKFLLNIDIMGAADKGITVVNGAVHEEQYNRLVEINTSKQYILEIKTQPQQILTTTFFRVRCARIFIYSMGSVTNYHDVYDSAENTPLHQFDLAQQPIIDFVAGL